MRLHDPLDYFGSIDPDRVLARFQGKTVTYGEGVREANRIANALIGAGLQPGDRVAILSKNSLESLFFFYGCAKAGVAPVPLNFRLAPPEWRYIIDDAGAKLVVTSAEYQDAIDGIRGELPKADTFAVFGSSPKEGWKDWSAWVAESSDAAPERYVPQDADLYQMYTSGTTGRPKGAVLRHEAVMSNVAQFMVAYPDISGGNTLIVAPLYHAAAGIMSFLAVTTGGSVLIQEDFVPTDVVTALSEGGVTTALLVPAMIQACLVMVPDVAERDYSKLTHMMYGASPIAAETLKKALQVFQCQFMQGYGMTETTAALTSLRPEDHQAALSGEKPHLLLAAGRALPGTDLQIVDDDRNPVPNGTIGEIRGRGPQLMNGYWNLPEATAEALSDGWMHTGDAGTMDDEGYVFIQDRVKDMIVSGGENVYPREIEEILYQLPAIAEAAVIGIPDEKWGEAVKAIVVLKPGETATAEEIVGHCKGELAGYKQPRSVDFIDVLPRNASGKVLKKDLREPYWTGHSRRVS